MSVSATEISFNSESDNLTIYAHHWRSPNPPKGIVLIAHGLAEYGLRYDRFAQALAVAGYDTYAIDHRGHAKSIGVNGLGHFGDGGWIGLCDDLYSFLLKIKVENPSLKIVLFGHSMGSFAAQRLCLDHSDHLDAVILSGSSSMDIMASAASSSELAKGGSTDDDSKVELSSFNAAFEPARTPFDWLSRDQAEVDKYIDNPLCGFDLQGESAVSMFSTAPYHGDTNAIAGIRGDLPVMLVAGDADPINGNLELLHLLQNRWQEEGGVENIQCAYYPQGRHEMLNETNREQVTTDVITWINRTIG